MALQPRKPKRKHEIQEQGLSRVEKLQTKHVNFLIPETLHAAFKFKAFQNNEKMTDLLVKFINEYVNK